MVKSDLRWRSYRGSQASAFLRSFRVGVPGAWRIALALVVGIRLITDAAEEKQSAEDLGSKVEQALKIGQHQVALNLVNKELAQRPKDPAPWLLRASIFEGSDQYENAIADYSRLLVVPEIAESKRLLSQAHERRGSAYFFAARIKESIADFDKQIELAPEQLPHHWKRGIDYYYAQQWEQGCQQFSAYQTIDSNDVENAVWWFLCKARSEGIDAAQREMLPIGRDQRVPMTEIYGLFLDKKSPEEVLKAIQTGQPTDEELKLRRFYANLYLGLWHEIHNRPDESLKCMHTAVNEFDRGGYMWQVARVHLWLREKNKKD